MRVSSWCILSSRVAVRFDLWGCVRFPGSSKVHGEFAVKHAWQGCPSSHLIRLRRQRSHALLSLNLRSFNTDVEGLS
jgi:hypothetical protein